MGNDYYTLKTCARDLAKDFGLELSYGEAKQKAARYDLAQSHGKNRDVETTAQRKETLTRLWRETETAEKFQIAARAAGYVIAQGQRRAFVVVDLDGQTHALARQIDGAKTKDIKARLGAPETYPTVETAKDEQHLRKEQQTVSKQQRSDLSNELRRMQKLRRMAQRADQLTETRHARLQQKEAEMKRQHVEEHTALLAKKKNDDERIALQRIQKRPKGVLKSICDAIGITRILDWLDHQEDEKRMREHQALTLSLFRLQMAERERYQQRMIRMRQQERREAKSINHLARQLGSEKVCLPSNDSRHIQIVYRRRLFAFAELSNGPPVISAIRSAKSDDM